MHVRREKTQPCGNYLCGRKSRCMHGLLHEKGYHDNDTSGAMFAQLYKILQT